MVKFLRHGGRRFGVQPSGCTVLEYLKAGARRFGSTRTDQFLRAFQELPEDKREAFSEFLT